MTKLVLRVPSTKEKREIMNHINSLADRRKNTSMENNIFPEIKF